MGYYSQVAIAVQPADAVRLKSEYLNKVNDKDDENPFWSDFFNDPFCTERKIQDGRVVFHWPSVRWYERSVPEVTFVMNFIRQLEEYAFLRIGEEFGDFETEGNPEEIPFWPSASIEFDC